MPGARSCVSSRPSSRAAADRQLHLRQRHRVRRHGDPALEPGDADEWHYIASDKPMQNAFIESFNWRLRDELLNEKLFTSLAQGSHCPRMLAGRLQRHTTTLAAWMENPVRVRLDLLPAPGPGAALCRGLRASPRRYHRHPGKPMTCSKVRTSKPRAIHLS